MPRRYGRCALVLLAAASVTAALAQPQMNVRDFGAVGDGKADDTAAIQKAADAAARATVAFQPEGGSYLGSSPPVYFPAGRYKLSGEIALGAYANVLSDGRAIVEQTGGCRSFVFPGGYTVTVKGIRFLGGTNQIHYSNANVDTSTLYIEGCEFQGSSEFAIYTIGTTDGHLSANLVIDRCKFILPRQVLHNACDAATVRDCWVYADIRNFTPDTAVFVNRGLLMFDNMFGVPVFPTTAETPDQSGARWVDNWGDLIVDRSRFGGEEAGIPVVFHYGKPHEAYPWMGQSVVIEHSQISAGNSSNPRAGVLTLREGMPQLIRIVGNRLLVDSPYIRVEGLDLDAFLAATPRSESRFSITVEPNMTTPRSPGVPPQLERYLQ